MNVIRSPYSLAFKSFRIVSTRRNLSIQQDKASIDDDLSTSTKHNDSQCDVSVENHDPKTGCSFKAKKSFKVPPELRLVLPDFLPEPDFKRRNPIAEKLERMDMLRRRQVLDIPEFYVGSIMAVTISDELAPKCANRFVGICIDRDDRGLRHHITLRNVIDGLGVEVQYNIYNPLIIKMEVLKLEKRVDDQLFYLRDALPEYSTIPVNMEPVILPPGTPVPVNTIKVKMQPPPWTKKWEHFDFQGMEDVWHLTHDLWKRRFTKTKFESWRKYDLVEQYRRSIPIDKHREVLVDIQEHDRFILEKFGGRKLGIQQQFSKK